MTVEEIELKIKRRFFKKISAKQNSIALRLTDGFKTVIAEQFYITDEYLSIVNGALREDFGLGKITEGFEAVQSVIQAIDDSIYIQFEETEDERILTISAFRKDFEDALGASGAKYQSDGGEVAWLSWILFRGAEVINPGFGVLRKKRKGVPYPVASSRTGTTIMRRMTENFRIPFSVPEQFQGTTEHNWITRVAEAAAPLLFELVKKEAKALISEGFK